MMTRYEPLRVPEGGTAAALVISKRPQEYFLRSLFAVVNLPAQSAFGASVVITFVAPGDGTVVCTASSGAVTFEFAAVDPGAPIVWIDNSGLVTAADYAAAFLTAVDAHALFVGTAVSAVETRVTTVVTGLSATLQISGSFVGMSFNPVSGFATGEDDAQLLPVLEVEFGGVNNFQCRVAPAVLTHAAGGTVHLTFGLILNNVAAIDPQTGVVLVNVALPADLRIEQNALVTLRVNSNSGATITSAFATREPCAGEWDGE